MSESSIKGSTAVCSKSFFMPSDAYAQLHDVSAYMAFTTVSETRGETSDKLETEDDWDTPNDELNHKHRLSLRMFSGPR